MDHAAVTALNHLLARNDGLEDPISLYEKLAELLFAGALVLAFFRREWRVTVVMAGASAALGLAERPLDRGVRDRRRRAAASSRGRHRRPRGRGAPGSRSRGDRRALPDRCPRGRPPRDRRGIRGA